jgi:hypothetical protein
MMFVCVKDEVYHVYQSFDTVRGYGGLGRYVGRIGGKECI